MYTLYLGIALANYDMDEIVHMSTYIMTRCKWISSTMPSPMPAGDAACVSSVACSAVPYDIDMMRNC